LQINFSQGDSIKVKNNIPNYSLESGFVYSENKGIKFGEHFTIEQNVDSESFSVKKIWISVGEGVFLFIEESFIYHSKILLTEKWEHM
jgi:hypothetical protein